MKSRYSIPAVPLHKAEENIKRSVFIVHLAHCATVNEAKAFIAGIQNQFADATHNCWAYACGAPGDTGQIGMSDDGEPHGTAGRPMLNILLHSNVGEIAAVVTRYFGGIKLGTGGLARAYSGMVAQALETLPVKEKIIPRHVHIVLEYSFITLAKRLFAAHEAVVQHEEFAQDAAFTLQIPQEHCETFENALTEMTNGNVLVEWLDDTNVDSAKDAK